MKQSKGREMCVHQLALQHTAWLTSSCLSTTFPISGTNILYNQISLYQRL